MGYTPRPRRGTGRCRVRWPARDRRAHEVCRRDSRCVRGAAWTAGICLKPRWGFSRFWGIIRSSEASYGAFVFSGVREVAVTTTTTLREKLTALIEPVAGRLGYELVDVEYAPGRSHGIVRIFIDRPAGIGLADCEQMSRETSALLDVEDPIPTAYTLEVSSPGFDRVLRTAAHFGRFVGSRVFVELKTPRDGRRRYTGTLVAADAAGIVLEVDRERVEVPLGEIGKARLAS